MIPITQEEVKSELRKYGNIRKECKLLRERLESKQNDIAQLRAVVSNGLPGGSEISDTVERAIELIDGLMRYYISKIIECEEAEARVLDMIDRAPDGLCRSILRLKYINGKRFEDIAVELHMSDRSMWNHYKYAIKKICSEMQ